MSRQMKNFADYFMQGMTLGASSAEKWQHNQILRENAKLKAQSDRIRENREERKLGLYGQNVAADIALKQARANRLNNPVAKGGGGGTASTPADVTGLLKEANELGIIATPTPTPAPAPQVTVTGGSDDGGGADAPAAAPPAAEVVTESEGGMVPRLAEGGIVEGMSLQEAQHYQGSPLSSSPSKKPAAGAGGAFSSAAASAASKYKAPEEKEKKAETPEVTPRGPAGSGVGGSYTEADVQSGGVLNTTYQSGGRVRRYQSGGRVMREPQAIDTGTSGPGSGYGYRAAPPARRY
jgi:hypothetical protein